MTKGFDLSEEDGKKVTVMDRGHLQRLIGVGQMYGIGYGDVGSSIYYALGVTTLWALGAAPLAILIAGVFFACTVLTYSELSAAMPESGGSQMFARRAFGDVASFIAGWALLLDYVLTIAISAYAVGPYLGNFHYFQILKTPGGNLMFASLLIVLLTGINIIGIKESTGFSLLLALLGVATQAVIICVGAYYFLDFTVISEQMQVGLNDGNLLYGISIAMVAYTGIEATAQLSGEARNPERTVPRAMLLVLLTVAIMYFGISLIAMSAFGQNEVLTANGKVGMLTAGGVKTWLNDPITSIVRLIPKIGGFLAPWVALLGATILIIATNAGVIGSSRVAYSMSGNLQLPGIFQRLHGRWRTPYIALTIFSGMAILVIWLARELSILADLYNFGAMLAFSLAHLALIGLRWKEPEMERPFYLKPSIPIAGRKIPITAIIGFLATFSVWLIVLITHTHGRNLGLIWMLSGLLLYINYRRKQHLPAGKTLAISKMTVTEFAPVTAKKILVPTLGGASTETVQVAGQIAREHKAELVAIYVIEVPSALPIDFFDPARLERADSALGRAEAIGREFGIPMETKLIQSRFAGESIVETARNEGFDLIVMGCVPKSSPGPGPSVNLGRTVEHVMRYAPCRIWLCMPGHGTRLHLP